MSTTIKQSGNDEKRLRILFYDAAKIRRYYIPRLMIPLCSKYGDKLLFRELLSEEALMQTFKKMHPITAVFVTPTRQFNDSEIDWQFGAKLYRRIINEFSKGDEDAKTQRVIWMSEFSAERFTIELGKDHPDHPLNLGSRLMLPYPIPYTTWIIRALVLSLGLEPFKTMMETGKMNDASHIDWVMQTGFGR